MMSVCEKSTILLYIGTLFWILQMIEQYQRSQLSQGSVSLTDFLECLCQIHRELRELPEFCLLAPTDNSWYPNL